MNILHLKYAVEVAKTKSISKAAENLYMGQPNLSRAIKELEESLGIIIFERNTKGITVTPDGEEFLQYARRIISQVEEIEDLYKNSKTKKQRFSACVPRASYISYAFTEFASHIDSSEAAEIFYKETNSMRTIDNVLKEEYNLGIVRYQSVFEPYFERKFAEKNLVWQTITEFSYLLLTSQNSPISKKKYVESKDLSDYMEITHADPYVPSLPLLDARKAEMSEFVDKRIFIFERGSQFGLLEKVPNTFMWVSPVPKDLLDKYNLVQIPASNSKKHKDVLIYRKDYKLSHLDNCFIDMVIKAKRKYLDEPFAGNI